MFDVTSLYPSLYDWSTAFSLMERILALPDADRDGGSVAAHFGRGQRELPLHFPGVSTIEFARVNVMIDVY